MIEHGNSGLVGVPIAKASGQRPVTGFQVTYTVSMLTSCAEAGVM